MSSHDKPKIFWASPLPPKETDIANYTARVQPILENARFFDEHDMKYFGPACEEAPGLFPVYNLGNDLRFHRQIFAVARVIPGLQIAHDVFLEESVEQLHKHQNNIPDSYKALEGQNFQALRWLSELALGIVTHNPSLHKTLAAEFDIPVFQLPLAYPSYEVKRNVTALTTRPFRLVMFGFIGKNRLLAEIIELVKVLQAEAPITLDIYGVITPDLRYLVQSAIQSLYVRYHDFVPSDELDAAIAQADLVLNLRHPDRGEASGSQLRIWNAKAPSVVFDSGWFSEIPDETAFKIDAENMTRQLVELVRFLRHTPEAGENIGRVGNARLRQTHSLENWKSAFDEICSFIPELWMSWAGARFRERTEAKIAPQKRLSTPVLAPSTPRDAIFTIVDQENASSALFLMNRLQKTQQKYDCDLVVLTPYKAVANQIAEFAPKLRVLTVIDEDIERKSASYSASYSLCAAPDLLGGDYDRLIFLSPDMVIRGNNIAKLFGLNMKAYPVAAVRNLQNMGGHKVIHPAFLRIETDIYLRENIGNRAIALMQDGHDPKTTLNSVLGQDWLELSPRWNWYWPYGGRDANLNNWLASVLEISGLSFDPTLSPRHDPDGVISRRWSVPFQKFIAETSLEIKSAKDKQFLENLSPKNSFIANKNAIPKVEDHERQNFEAFIKELKTYLKSTRFEDVAQNCASKFSIEALENEENKSAAS